MTSPVEVLRRRLSEGPALMAPGAYDPLSARLVEQVGFEVVYLTGGGYSRACGFPDLGLLTMTEVATYVGRVVDSVTIPVVADLDNGYGSALNVVRAVREFERAGAAAFHIEDQVLPKKCGHYEGKAVISVGEMVGKIHAAVDSRRNDTVVIARTDARAIEGLDAAIDRVEAYLDAGADLGFVEAPQAAEELRQIVRRCPLAATANIFEGGKTPFVAAKSLEEWGFRLIIYPSQTQRAAMKAVSEVLLLMKDREREMEASEMLVSFAEREVAVGASEWNALAQRYASTEPAVGC